MTTEKLLYREQMWLGMVDEEPEKQPDLRKLQRTDIRRFQPGSTIMVEWKSSIIDAGYIFVLPGADSDILMSGFVHIPQMEDCERGDCSEWIHLSDLLCLDGVVSVRLDHLAKQ